MYKTHKFDQIFLTSAPFSIRRILPFVRLFNMPLKKFPFTIFLDADILDLLDRREKHGVVGSPRMAFAISSPPLLWGRPPFQNRSGEQEACNMRIALTVFFESPFWVGILERTDGQGRLSAARYVFGAEPSDQQVYQWLLAEFFHLRFSPAQPGAPTRPLADNPKRRQRQAAKAVATGSGTRAQQAIQAGREANRQERQTQSRAQRKADAKRRFLLEREKRKQRHRGR